MTVSNVPEWAGVTPTPGQRRLPVYLLLDASGSMEGAPIESVRQGLEQFQSEVASDPFSRDTVHVGVITFNNDAVVANGGLQPITDFQPPQLIASGVTRLDLAFERLRESMDHDVVRPVRGGQRGDYKPIVFVLTDGNPTDGQGYFNDSLWGPARESVVNRPKGAVKPSIVVAVGCGPDVKDETLKAISTGTAFRMGTDRAAFVALFQWLSQSIVSSVQPGASPDQEPLAPVDPSSDLLVIP